MGGAVKRRQPVVRRIEREGIDLLARLLESKLMEN
jgi:hypothetical protein